MPSILTIVLRICMACLFGGIIGFKRTQRLKEAGIRTHCLIASASAFMMIISQYGFSEGLIAGEFVAGTRGADAARIAAQVISGISFLGAGVIFRNGSSVKGLTTAAGIWATSGVGLAVGCGMYIPGLVLTLVVLCIQLVFHRYSIGNDVYSENEVKIVAGGNGSFKSDFMGWSEQKKVQILSIKAEQAGNETTYTVVFRPSNSYSTADIEHLLEQYPEIQSISMSC